MKKRITYPKVNNDVLTIGVTAPSSGLGEKALINRLELLTKQHAQRGIKVIEGKCLREDNIFVSGTSLDRADDFMTMWNDPRIDLIHPPWGGEFLIDILEHIDFDSLAISPTWLQGYSDISTLLFAITSVTGIATAHGTNFMDSIDGQDLLTSRSREYLSLEIEGAFKQDSGLSWQEEFVPFRENISTKFNLTKDTKWKILSSHTIEFEGRIIGGCIDVISELCGTKFGDLLLFKETYTLNDGLILYFENSEQSPKNLYRILMKFKLAGWLENLNGVIFGRNNGPEDRVFPYEDCIKKVFKDVAYPVILDADIGHCPPQMTIINGAFAKVTVTNGSATLIQTLRP
ncbi:MAG: LD-carboxypeptidase [Bacteriovoracaceae bacterium]|nr:LD-carboxypeptidase [Bacteriovoracaceae bacterium]